MGREKDSAICVKRLEDSGATRVIDGREIWCLEAEGSPTRDALNMTSFSGEALSRIGSGREKS